MDEQQERAAYVVPSYRAPGDVAWYHFLHGNVPGHQIDFIYRAEVPQGPLTRQHFSHLSRLMKYIEPQSNERFAFAIGNLSRDDTQYEPGHGGVALIFGLRIHGATDHAGRQDPPFAHAVAAIDRALDYSTFVESAVAFHRHVLGGAESAEWYRAYVHDAPEDPGSALRVLESYVSRFADLPQPGESAMGVAWVTGGAVQPRRIVIAHDDDTTFGEVAAVASRIASILYRSDIRWTVISNGREDDVPNGVTIRVLSRAELGPADAAATVHDISALPEEEVDLASLLFGASPLTTEVKKPRGWRDRYSEAEPPPPPARARVRRGAGEDEISVDIEIGQGRSSNEPPVRRSAPGAQPEPLPDALAPTVQAPLRPAPPSIRPQPASEPPAGDRAAILEAPIPPASRLPEPEPEPKVPPPATPAPPPPPRPPVTAVPPAAALPVPALIAEPPPARSRRMVWVVVIGCALLAAALVAFLGRPSETPPLTPGPASAAPVGEAPPAATPAVPAHLDVAPEAPPSTPSPAPSASAAPRIKHPPSVPRTPALLSRPPPR